eukprot:scaffold116021_cov32-Tisochrysis_lutea.AAC.1
MTDPRRMQHGARPITERDHHVAQMDEGNAAQLVCSRAQATSEKMICCTTTSVPNLKICQELIIPLNLYYDHLVL